MSTTNGYVVPATEQFQARSLDLSRAMFRFAQGFPPATRAIGLDFFVRACARDVLNAGDVSEEEFMRREAEAAQEAMTAINAMVEKASNQ